MIVRGVASAGYWWGRSDTASSSPILRHETLHAFGNVWRQHSVCLTACHGRQTCAVDAARTISADAARRSACKHNSTPPPEDRSFRVSRTSLRQTISCQDDFALDPILRTIAMAITRAVVVSQTNSKADPPGSHPSPCLQESHDKLDLRICVRVIASSGVP